MNYNNKKVAITGVNGFIGRHVAANLENEGAEVVVLSGDIRDRRTFDALDHTFDYLFHFAAPSSQVQFKRTPSYCIQTTITGFMNAATAAKRHNVRFVYPSTGLLSSDQELNAYALCKKLCELYAAGKNMDAIGLRIFATYGPGEDHKRDFASVPFLFARDMVAGRAPIIYGNGEQVRDFIYIDDVAQAIVVLAEECPDPVVDVGMGNTQSFNNIVLEINKAMASTHDPIQADYVPAPGGYVKETHADNNRLTDFYMPQVAFQDGIKRLVSHLKELQEVEK